VHLLFRKEQTGESLDDTRPQRRHLLPGGFDLSPEHRVDTLSKIPERKKGGMRREKEEERGTGSRPHIRTHVYEHYHLAYIRPNHECMYF
jgi:hypothetical protein